MDKVWVIERSLRCFIAGCLSLIPLLGIIAAIFAIVLFHQVRNETAGAWNPARSYLIGGAVLAWAGVTITLMAVALRLPRYLV